MSNGLVPGFQGKALPKMGCVCCRKILPSSLLKTLKSRNARDCCDIFNLGPLQTGREGLSNLDTEASKETGTIHSVPAH